MKKLLAILRTFYSLFNKRVFFGTFIFIFIIIHTNVLPPALSQSPIEVFIWKAFFGLYWAIPLSFIVGTVQYVWGIFKEVKAKKEIN